MKQLDFKITSYDFMGSMSVLINGTSYIYFIESIWIDAILKLEKHKPGKALQLLKEKARDFYKINS